MNMSTPIPLDHLISPPVAPNPEIMKTLLEGDLVKVRRKGLEFWIEIQWFEPEGTIVGALPVSLIGPDNDLDLNNLYKIDPSMVHRVMSPRH